ncbi:MAG TPA: GxGYxYP domain-containing protein [Thermoplasmata archaeon]|nr:GxGYxYP domain-containing protein [Thermoplasmata archaeon]
MRTHGRRTTSAAVVIVAALFFLVIFTNVLWPGPPPASAGQPRMPPDQSPFPLIASAPTIHVVTVDASTNLSTRLLLASLQGLANRARAELYLDTTGEISNASSMLAFLTSKYNVTYDVMTIDAALATYMPRVTGLAVYAPSKPESVNVATMIAAQQGDALVGPDLAPSLSARFGLPIAFNYADPAFGWPSLDAVAATDRALHDLYAGSSSTLLSILPPDRWAIRDYLIATRTFVFYEPQGALASPFETAATMRVLRATPRGIPILGWFRSPTLTEENAFIQMASAEGKSVVGVQDLPNLSVLTAFGRNATHRQSAPSTSTRALEDKTYVVLAVPDGDNLDFVAGRMRQLWAQPERGTVPIAWSMSPVLADLAPPLLDEYYDSATSLDRFIAAPSGAGYIYPDYLGPGDLAAYLASTKRYMAAADLDVVWLLNAFTASEIPYGDETLSEYANVLHPAGLVLDYDDQPRSASTWVVAGTDAAAPVIRSTHFWSTAENLYGKLDPVFAAQDGGPQFLWVTIYTFRFDLRDALAVVGEISRRIGGNFEVVSPTDFFDLLTRDVVGRADLRLAGFANDPLASTIFAGSLDSARRALASAHAEMSAGATDFAAYHAFVADETLRGISSGETLLLSLLVLLVAALLVYYAERSSKDPRPAPERICIGPLILVTAAVAFFVFALRESLEQNFWTYPTVFLAIIVAGVHRPLRRLLDRAYPHAAPVAAALACLVLSSLAIRTSIGFPLATIGTLLATDAYLARKPATPSTLVAALAFGSAIGFVGGFDLPTFTAMAVLLVLPPLLLRTTAPPSDSEVAGPRALYTGILLAVPLAAVSIATAYALSLRLDLQGDTLVLMAGVMLVLGPAIAILAARMLPHLTGPQGRAGGLGLAVAFAGLVLVVRGTIPTVLALLGLFVSLSFAALAGLRDFENRGGDPSRALATSIVFLLFIVLFFRLPPIVYSLTLVPLPEVLETFLYTPTSMIAVTALILAVLGLLVSRRPSVGKDYLGEAHGGPGGP